MSSLKHSPCVEVELEVSAGIMGHPLGFVIDAGGSLTKLIYRSKEDYEKGTKIKPADQGILRLKSFTIEQLPGLVDYIKTHVDVCLREDDKDVVWWHTGISMGCFRSQLEKELNIKTKLHSELMGLCKCLQAQDQTGVRLHETFVECIEGAAKLNKELMKMIFSMQDMGEDSFDFQVHEKDKVKSEASEEATKGHFPSLPADHYLLRLVEGDDYQGWIDKHLKGSGIIESPSLLLLVGSAGVIGLFDEDFKLKFIEYTPACGKTLCGLAEALTGEKDFAKFIQLAEEGDTNNVDQMAKDLKCDEVVEGDWYSAFPKDIVAFELGKLSSNNVDGKSQYSKADLAAGLVSLQLHTMSRMMIANARIKNVFTTYVCGSMFQFPYTRKVFEKHYYNDSLIVSMEYGRPFKVHFLDNPGYLVGLGVWMQNVKEEKERRSQRP